MAEDLITRYQLDISDLRLQVKQLEDQFKKLTDAEKKSAKEGEEAFKKTDDAVKKTGNSLNVVQEIGQSFRDSLKNIGSAIVGAFAAQQIIAFAQDCVQSFGEAEKSALLLKNAVGVNGGLSDDFDRLLEQSSELQNTTIFSDETIQSAQIAALQFGLSAKEVEKLIPIIADFASATNQDLNSALSGVIGAINGQERALKPYGITIDNTASAVERFADVQEQLNKKFAGQAEAVGETTLGRIERLKNAWDDSKESVGAFTTRLAEGTLGLLSFITNGFQLEDELDEIGKKFNGTKEQLEGLNSSVLDFQISNLQRQIQAGGGDLKNLQEQLKKLTQQKNEITIGKLDDKQILEQIKKIEAKGVFLTPDDTEYLKALKNVSKQRNLDSIVAEKELTKLTTAELKNRLQELEKENKEGNSKFIDDTIKNINKELEKRAEANKKIAEEQKKNLDALQKFADDANQKSLESVAKTEEEKLKVQRDAALKQAALLLEQAGGEKNKAAVKIYNEAILAIEKDFAEQIKNAKLKSTLDYYNEQFKISEQNSKQELDTALKNIEVNQNEQILALKQAYISKGDFSVEAEKKLQDDITKIQLDSERKRADETFKLKEAAIEKERLLQIQSAITTTQQQSGLIGLQLLQSVQFQKAVTEANKNANDKKLQNDKEYADALNKLGLKIVDGQIQVASTGEQNWIESNEAKIQASVNAANEILNVLNILTQNQIDAKQQELTRLQEGYDAEDAELQLRFEQRLIGAAEYEKEQDRIKQARIESEKKINRELNDLKRKQDIANRAQAIFEILINTSVAVSKLLATPFLAIAAGIAGAAQLTAVLATPLPKYAKGTKYLQRGNNPVGVDTIPILANEGERIIPTDRNKKYWSIYEAIDGNKFDEFISRKYIAPALQRQMNDYKKSESLSFAENISNSLIFNHDLLASKIGSEIEWRNRNGIKVKGMQDLIDALTTTTDLRKR